MSIWRALSEVFVERESCGWGHGLRPSLDVCIEENTAFWSCSFLFNAIQQTAAVVARWAAKPLVPPLLSSHTPTFVAFRFYLAALRAHDLIDASKKAFLITSYEGGFEWGVHGLLSM